MFVRDTWPTSRNHLHILGVTTKAKSESKKAEGGSFSEDKCRLMITSKSIHNALFHMGNKLLPRSPKMGEGGDWWS